MRFNPIQVALLLVSCFFLSIANAENWQQVATEGAITARHEAGLIAHKKNIYLLGGRRLNPVNILNTKTLTWQTAAKPPMEMHHFQPVIWKNKIVVLGAMTGPYPKEKPLSHIYYYLPKKDIWQQGPEIPANRRRGGAGVVIDGNKIYMIGGTNNGHIDGYSNAVDVYDFKKKTWQVLADAPHKRDHFQAAIINGKIYAAGGRQTSQATNELFTRVVPEVDIYDIKTNRWQVAKKPLPTPRAGNSTIALNGKLYVIGGESARPTPAHNEVEVYDPETESWKIHPPLLRGRHGTGLGIARGYLWTASGAGNQGGGPELKTTERMLINK